MSDTIKKIVGVVIIVVVLGLVGAYVFKKNIGSVSIPNKALLTESLSGITVPEGFSLSVFAKDVPGARVIALDSFGNIWVSQTSEGTITKLEIKNGAVAGKHIAFKNLDKPHGLVIDNDVLYYAEQTKITRTTLYSDDPGEKIADLPKGGSHFTRTLMLGPDDRLYVSIGSTCNVCIEKDERYAAIYSMKKDGSDFKMVASGLRNSVFMAVDPVNGKIFATEMGRDSLGDNIPPDEINIIEPGKNYGWPFCYGRNIYDDRFDPDRKNTCTSSTSSFVDLQAHSAPLGLAFVPEEGWPEDYWYNILVAYHGSWNRSEPTGYKVVRIKMNAKGEYLGTEDFITGFLNSDGKKIGRPVDIKILPGGTAYISDDSFGVIYRLVAN